ncbi:citrate lyase subunit beta/citryl-CoA lyase [Paraburkholderia sp. BL6669N2]|uniref:HpcH/HpaI aldolase/citrate lyase family protein n=1 Tax=Paraburkholderia sp. BL6669N2 TaxID=1938807 RepID=UPI000E21E65E|nr:CoA ester lyase [Paraburkholderia sp. BL6669N2]REG50987.1 citrate lyase subunit beta/citryl-CoA lyase [Paraburkholderia sp. BL6669N2]
MNATLAAIAPRPTRPRRVQLAVPGSNARMIEKAAACDADHVFLDLEDAVAPNAKVGARRTVSEALLHLDWGTKTRCVRINDLDTPYAYDDLTEVIGVAGSHLDVVMLPKVTRPEHIQFVDRLLTMLEHKHDIAHSIGLEILIEEIEGLVNVESLCKTSRRLEAAILGVGDYSAAQGIAPSAVRGTSGYPGDLWHYPRFKLVAAARAAGIAAIDGPFADVRNGAAYAEECRTGALLGFDGKWALHPSQIGIAKQAFTPDLEDVRRARAIAAAYADAQAQGIGAVELDGMMIDVASVRLVSNTLRKADLFGM